MVVGNKLLPEALGFVVFVREEATIVGANSKVTEGFTGGNSVVVMDFVMVVASNTEDCGISILLAVAVDG